jgi:hypothetical protein
MPHPGREPLLRLITVPTPAAGAEFVVKAPGEGLWRMISIAAIFTASAAVANRRPSLLADDQTDVYWAAESTVDIAAAAAVRVCAYTGAVGAGLTGVLTNLPLPTEGLILQPGYRLRSSTALIDVADQWSAVRAQVMEYPNGPDYETLPGPSILLAATE